MPKERLRDFATVTYVAKGQGTWSLLTWNCCIPRLSPHIDTVKKTHVKFVEHANIYCRILFDLIKGNKSKLVAGHSYLSSVSPVIQFSADDVTSTIQQYIRLYVQSIVHIYELRIDLVLCTLTNTKSLQQIVRRDWLLCTVISARISLYNSTCQCSVVNFGHTLVDVRDSPSWDRKEYPLRLGLRI